MEEAFKLADEHNPQVLAARNNLLQAQANIRIAREVPNPQLQAAYGFGPTTTKLQNTQQVLVVQTLELGNKRHARTVLAKSQYDLALAQLNDLRQTIRSQVRQTYAELIAAEETAANLKEQEKLLKELIDITQKRYDAGAAPQSEVVQATLSHNQIIPVQAQVDGRIRQDRIALYTLLGQSVPTNFELSDNNLPVSKGTLTIQIRKTRIAPELSLPSIDTLEQEAFAHRFDLQAATQQVDVAKKQVAVTRSLRIPNLDVGAGYVFLNTHGEDIQGAVTSLSMTLPVYHNQQAELLRDQSILHQNETQVIALKQQIQSEVETAYAALQTAIVNVHLYEDQLLPQAEDLGQLARLSYQVGKTGMANVILAQQSMRQVRSGYLEAMIAYQKAWADLEKAIGGPLE
jgi:cobalt-zinc-cadmium efflux system outer membrane protein